MTRPAEIDAEVAGARGQVGDDRISGKPEISDGLATPPHVEPKGHHPVDQVVARCDRVEHFAHCDLLGRALGQRLVIPG